MRLVACIDACIGTRPVARIVARIDAQAVTRPGYFLEWGTDGRANGRTYGRTYSRASSRIHRRAHGYATPGVIFQDGCRNRTRTLQKIQSIIIEIFYTFRKQK